MRIALRTLFRSRAFALSAIGTIALSIALAAVVFAVIDGVLFKPLPFPAPERLFEIRGVAADGTAGLSVLDVEYLREADSRIAIAAQSSPRGLRHPDRPDVVVWAIPIDLNFFAVVGKGPMIGGFTPDHYRHEMSGDEPQPALISYSLWSDRLGADRFAVGRVLDLIGTRVLVVGVMPRDFVFPHPFGRLKPDILVPFVDSAAESRNRWQRPLMAVARVDPAISIAEAQAKLDAVLAARSALYPPVQRRVRPGAYTKVSLTPLEEQLGRAERPLFRAAFGGAMLLVLLGCVNVAGLLAARGRARERELTVRVALGASRGVLLHLLLTEAVVIAVCGAVVGLLLARPLLNVAIALLPGSLLLLKAPSIDMRVIGFATAAAVLTLTFISLLGLISIVRGALMHGFSGGLTITPRVGSWTRSAVLAAESAVGLTLVVVGSLMLTTFVAVRAADPGFDRERVAVLEVLTPGAVTTEDQRSRHARVLERLSNAPDVAAASMVGSALLEEMSIGSRFAFPEGAERGDFMVNDVPIAGAFFEVAGLTLLDGRVLSPEELIEGRPVAVVSELTARRYWPGERAVGQTLTGDGGKVSVSVVGVVEEARWGSQADTTHSEIYVPLSLRSTNLAAFLLKIYGDPDRVIRQLAWAVNRDVPGVVVRRAEGIETALARSVGSQRFRAAVFGAAASAALVLLAVGIAGLVAMAVTRRVRELGIRVALGARRAAIRRLIVIEHLRPVLIGMVAGLVASWWTTQLVGRFMYGFAAHDPWIWGAGCAVLVLTAAAAAWIPAHRASGVDPASALRTE